MVKIQNIQLFEKLYKFNKILFKCIINMHLLTYLLDIPY